MDSNIRPSTTAPRNASDRMSPRTVQNHSDRTLKRRSQGTYLRISSKRPQRFVPELAGHHNIRDLDTIARMVVSTRGLAGKQLRHR